MIVRIKALLMLLVMMVAIPEPVSAQEIEERVLGGGGLQELFNDVTTSLNAAAIPCEELHEKLAEAEARCLVTRRERDCAACEKLCLAKIKCLQVAPWAVRDRIAYCTTSCRNYQVDTF